MHPLQDIAATEAKEPEVDNDLTAGSCLPIFILHLPHTTKQNVLGRFAWPS